MITTVIFDIGNVLTDFCWEEFYRQFHYPEEIFERLAAATVRDPIWHEFDRGVLSDEEILNAFIQNDPGIEKELREIFADIHGIVTKRDYAVDWIKDLKARGCKVYVLSNFAAKSAKECADALDFLPFTDGGILSYQDKLIKPDPAIYRLLLDRYHLAPEECVFIDDLERNTKAAAAFGMHTITFTTKEAAQEELEKLLPPKAAPLA